MKRKLTSLILSLCLAITCFVVPTSAFAESNVESNADTYEAPERFLVEDTESYEEDVEEDSSAEVYEENEQGEDELMAMGTTVTVPPVTGLSLKQIDNVLHISFKSDCTLFQINVYKLVNGKYQEFELSPITVSMKDFDILANPKATTYKVTVKAIEVKNGKKYYSTGKSATCAAKVYQEITGLQSSYKIAKGKTISLKPSAMTALTYKSLDPAIASVSNTGVVKGLAIGKARITVSAASSSTYTAASKTTTINVTAPYSNGWHRIGGALYYYKNGEPFTGTHKIKKKVQYYYYGKSKTQTFTNSYYFGSTGKLRGSSQKMYNKTMGTISWYNKRNKRKYSQEYVIGICVNRKITCIYKNIGTVKDPDWVVYKYINSSVGRLKKYKKHVSSRTPKIIWIVPTRSQTKAWTGKNMRTYLSYFHTGGIRDQYATRIIGYGKKKAKKYNNYFFHTVPYRQGASANNYSAIRNGKMGECLSGGCIRLRTPDAKWIYDNIKEGTLVRSYNQ